MPQHPVLNNTNTNDRILVQYLWKLRLNQSFLRYKNDQLLILKGKHKLHCCFPRSDKSTMELFRASP